MKRYNVAVVGATGAVGREMLQVLEQRNFPTAEIRPLASARSAGRKLEFKNRSLTVQELGRNSFEGIDIALFSAGSAVSHDYAPLAVEDGAVVIDNSSAYRMEPDVPLVVPEVNPDAAASHQGIIANPNCSTIQMVVVLKPLHDAAGLRRVVVSTYQSVSGTGRDAMDELIEQSRAILEDRPFDPSVYPHQIAFNALPHIDVFFENGYTKEEIKMVEETRKIMGLPELRLTATAVRVPVLISHAESVNLETDEYISAANAKTLLASSPGVEVIDDPQNAGYPTPTQAAGQDSCYVGRIRNDPSIGNGLNLWIVADNLRKGAALNAVQIAELISS